nr:N-acetylmuramoyl-L-alanine amidase [Bacillus velezensis]
MPTIILDPGHGGKDIGAAGNGLIEKKLALEFALNVELFLKKSVYLFI